MFRELPEPQPAVTPVHPLLQSALAKSLTTQSRPREGARQCRQGSTSVYHPGKGRECPVLLTTYDQVRLGTKSYSGTLARLRRRVARIKFSPLLFFLCWTAIQCGVVIHRSLPLAEASGSVLEDVFLLAGVLSTCMAEACAVIVGLCICLTVAECSRPLRPPALTHRRFMFGYSVIGVLAILCAVFMLRLIPARELPLKEFQRFSQDVHILWSSIRVASLSR